MSPASFVAFLDFAGATVQVNPELVEVISPVPAPFLPSGLADGTYIETSDGETRLAVQGDVATVTAALSSAAPPPAGMDCTRWYPAETSGNEGSYRVRSVGSTGAWRFNFVVPDDFATLTELKLIGWPNAGAAGTGKPINMHSMNGAEGEQFDQHQFSLLATNYNLGTQETIVGLNLAPAFPILDAGDYAGVEVDHQGIGGTMSYLGIRLRYTTL